MLALFLLPFVRDLIDGPTPLHRGHSVKYRGHILEELFSVYPIFATTSAASDSFRSA